MDDGDQIILHPDQVPTLIQWLQEAHTSVLKEGPRLVEE